MEEDFQQVALSRAEVLRSVLVLEKDGGEIGAAVAAAAVDLGISRSTAWRLLSLLRENDGRASALLPKRSGPKLGSLRLSRQVEDLIDQGRVCTDPDARAAIYARAYGIMQQDPPWLTLYNPIRTTGLAGAHPGFALPADAVLDAARLPAFAQVPHG